MLTSGLWLEGVVYFTDGRAQIRDLPSVPTLWAITHADPFRPDFGAIVRIP